MVIITEHTLCWAIKSIESFTVVQDQLDVSEYLRHTHYKHQALNFSNPLAITKSYSTVHGPALSPPPLRNGNIVKHRGWVPAGIQVVVGSRERSFGRPEPVQDSRDVVRVGGYSFLKHRNWEVSDLQLPPSLCLICLEYLVERLF
jgi:hypothetical protein